MRREIYAVIKRQPHACMCDFLGPDECDDEGWKGMRKELTNLFADRSMAERFAQEGVSRVFDERCKGTRQHDRPGAYVTAVHPKDGVRFAHIPWRCSHKDAEEVWVTEYDRWSSLWSYDFPEWIPLAFHTKENAAISYREKENQFFYYERRTRRMRVQ